MRTAEAIPALLVIGGSGFIGGRLVQAAHERGHAVTSTFASRSCLLPGRTLHADFATGTSEELSRSIADTGPDAVVYCAAPSARADAVLHRRVSIDGVWQVLECLRTVRPDARFIYVSTNAVFGGDGPRTETAPPESAQRRDDLLDYACAKAEAEQLVLREWPGSLVVRTATVGGRKADGTWSRRLGAAIAELRGGGIIRRFDDRFISPTLVDDLTAAILETLEPAWGYNGILHVAGADCITDYEYTRLLAHYLGCDTARVVPEHMREVPAMQGSPHDTTLNSTLARQLLRTPLRGVKAQLEFLLPPLPASE